jgi:group II intron reverse transcriptase/maturase
MENRETNERTRPKMIVEHRLDRLAKIASVEKDKRFDRLFKELTKGDFLLYAYEQIRQNKGSKTPGIDGVTKHEWEKSRTIKLAQQLSAGEYEPVPVRRVLIDKKNKPGQKRPLGIPTLADRIVQSGIKLILEAIYEPLFLDCSHGFRPQRACHTAFAQIYDSPSVRIDWIIEGDIKGCFDNISHQKLLQLLQKRIKDDRFLKLIAKFLKAGYFEQKRWNPTKSGTPQGGIVSPILANIYLHELDKFVQSEFGANQTSIQNSKEFYARANPEWQKLQQKISFLRGMLKGKRRMTIPEDVAQELLQQLIKQRSTTPSRNQPIKSRLTYVRYADDFVILLRNLPKTEAERIKTKVTEWVWSELHLVLSPDKTAITHIKEGFNFLGYKFIPQKTTLTQPKVKMVIPFSSAQAKLKDAKAICNKFSTSEVEVIRKLNDMLRGWMIYYRCVHAPNRVMASVLSHTWWIYAKYVSRKNNCNIAKAAKRWNVRCPASAFNPKGGQKTWFAETENEDGKMLKEYLICSSVQKCSLHHVARKIRQGIPPVGSVK